MTQEEKARAYDETLKRAKRMFSEKELNYLFPELQESEDERIRKAIHIYLDWLDGRNKNYQPKGDYSIRDMIAWLEKQGEQKSTDNLTPQEAMDIAVAKCFDEQKPANSYCQKSCKGFQETGKCFADGNCKAKREAESIGKAEPKFQNGQWIVWQNKCYKVNDNGCSYELIDQDDLKTSLEYGTVDENAHLWSIADAKDGDVLSDGTTIFIFKDLLSDGSVMSYCDYDTDSGESDAFCPLSMNLMFFKITPATKEQRDALEKAMDDAGYTFDFEKKELKKIEEEYNGEDYGIDSLFHAQRILEKTLGKVDGYQSDDGILSHKCAITAIKKLCEQEPVWSENDENHWMLRIVQHNKEQTSQKQ